MADHHGGHRERLKQRYREHGLGNFNDINTLELLLIYAIPRRDVNPTAHSLLDHFGTLDAVLEAPVEELKKVEGVGENAATLINLILQINKRYFEVKNRERKAITNTKEAGQYFVPLFKYETVEVLLMVCLDAKRKIICRREISRGIVNITRIDANKIVGAALNTGAAGVIISHNHPSGFALPSIEDRDGTLELRDLLAGVGVELCDHIIVADDSYVSLADRGVLKEKRSNR